MTGIVVSSSLPLVDLHELMDLSVEDWKRDLEIEEKELAYWETVYKVAKKTRHKKRALSEVEMRKDFVQWLRVMVEDSKKRKSVK